MGFYIELPNLSLRLMIKAFRLIEGAVPSTYGEIMNDIHLSNDVTLESLSFYDVFEELMTKSKFFLEDKSLSNKNLFFLRKCGVHRTYHWVHVHGWSESGYAIGENPNANYFVEPWRNASDCKSLLENSVFFVLDSKKKIITNLEDNEDDWAEREAHRITGSSLKTHP